MVSVTSFVNAPLIGRESICTDVELRSGSQSTLGASSLECGAVFSKEAKVLFLLCSSFSSFTIGATGLVSYPDVWT